MSLRISGYSLQYQLAQFPNLFLKITVTLIEIILLLYMSRVRKRQKKDKKIKK